jgi:hypothetical protein
VRCERNHDGVPSGSFAPSDLRYRLIAVHLGGATPSGDPSVSQGFDALEDAADGTLTVKLDVLGTILRRVGKGQAILIVHLAGDERMEHDFKLARAAKS